MVAVAVTNGSCKKKLDTDDASLSTVARKMRTKLHSRRSMIIAVSEEWEAVRAMISVTWVLDLPSDCPAAPLSHCRSRERADRHGTAAPPPSIVTPLPLSSCCMASACKSYCTALVLSWPFLRPRVRPDPCSPGHQHRFCDFKPQNWGSM